jgi:hypothetical protein
VSFNLFDPENGKDAVLRNIGYLSEVYMASYHKSYKPS